jgi:hypothetical protein
MPSKFTVVAAFVAVFQTEAEGNVAVIAPAPLGGNMPVANTINAKQRIQYSSRKFGIGKSIHELILPGAATGGGILPSEHNSHGNSGARQTVVGRGPEGPIPLTLKTAVGLSLEQRSS